MSVYHQILQVPAPIVLSEEELMIQAEFRAFMKHLQNNLSFVKDFDSLSETLQEMIKETAKVKKSLQ